jgi:hypothetical protein
MTKKEQLKMNCMIREIDELRKANTKHLHVYATMQTEIISLRARLETLREVMDYPVGWEYEVTK